MLKKNDKNIMIKSFNIFNEGIKDILNDNDSRELITKIKINVPESEQQKLLNILIRKGYDEAYIYYLNYDPDHIKKTNNEAKRKTKTETYEKILDEYKNISIDKKIINNILNELFFDNEVRKLINIFSAPQPTTSMAEFTRKIFKTGFLIEDKYKIENYLNCDNLVLSDDNDNMNKIIHQKYDKKIKDLSLISINIVNKLGNSYYSEITIKIQWRVENMLYTKVYIYENDRFTIKNNNELITQNDLINNFKSILIKAKNNFIKTCNEIYLNSLADDYDM